MKNESKSAENKKRVRAFYEEFFNSHRIESALTYVREDYIQHNPGVGNGVKGLMDAFAAKFAEHPEFHLEIKMMIAENDMVMVYLKNTDEQGNTRCRVVDIYRVEDGMLAEHWDVLQPVQEHFLQG